MEVVFLGFGLIGGSIARALRASPPKGDGSPRRLVAWSPSGRGPDAALADGILDRVATSPTDAVRSADLVVIAAPPLPAIDLLETFAGSLAAGLGSATIITDVASTKGRIVERATALGLPFVGGHPMAGLEATGYGSSRADLFIDRPWVVVPVTPDDERALVVERLARDVGARPFRMDATAHDRAVASISHLPLVLAAALVEAVAGPAGDAAPAAWADARALAATGWRDMTRLARGDVEMATGIALTNAPALAGQLRAMRGVLDTWLDELEAAGGPDEDRLRTRFLAARRRLDDVVS